MSLPAFPELKTERLILRELTHADASAMAAMHRDHDAMRHWGAAPLDTEATAHDFIARCRAGWQYGPPVFRWALEARSGGTMLGTCGLFNWDPRWHRCTLGYELARSAWQQGYMREALVAVLGWAFQTQGIHRVDALIHPDNAASLRLAQYLGFRIEGRLREAAFWDNRFHDMALLGLLASELRVFPN